MSFLTGKCCFYGCEKQTIVEDMIRCDTCDCGACKKCGNEEFEKTEYDDDTTDYICSECASDRKYNDSDYYMSD